MHIIPVLDLKGGKVVRAEGGRRDRYRPIVTPLSRSADPVAVADGLRSLHPFPTFYIADLDAIEKRAPNRQALQDIAGMPDAPELWLDAGFADEPWLSKAFTLPSVRPVLGSESQADEALLRRFRDHTGLVLSLDFFADGFRGPPILLAEPRLWPQTVIVMTLAKVGSAAGPDFARLEDIRSKAGSRSVIAAGGVRDARDLRRLSKTGIAGALMATALHDGAVTSRQLAELSHPRPTHD